MDRGRDLTWVASAIDNALDDLGDGGQESWTTVELLRLRADLYDRLAATGRPGAGAVARLSEFVRDRAEQLADELSGLHVVPVARDAEIVHLWGKATGEAG
ncbi:hypothetical protein D5S17_01855 [Pseudonocardiaceae bacterium YIM PH 21723]|nr:hypothetical protein D5S17_01855 [Pseudonocardiaceae bacterium YIM PH 21723]